MKKYLYAFISLNLLIITLCIINLIPKELIHNNLYDSITWYKESYSFSLVNANLSKAHFNSDAAELDIMNSNDNKHPIKSTILSPIYLISDEDSYLDSSYDCIIHNKNANTTYNQYWHGYQILWKPLLIFFNANMIKWIIGIIYTILVLYIAYKCIKLKYKPLGIGLILLNIFYIVPCGFVSLSYIPIYFITMIGCLFLLNKKYEDFIFILLGICTSFFDFLSSETLTLTVPLLCFIYLYKNDIKFIDIIKKFINWICGYTFTFLYKWTLSSIIDKQNYIKLAINNYTNNHIAKFSKLDSIKYNINTLLGNKFSFNTSFTILLLFILLMILIVYLFRNPKSSWKYFVSILCICTIPYIRYFIMSSHSFAHHFFTYRAQLVLIVATILTIYEVFLENKNFK